MTENQPQAPIIFIEQDVPNDLGGVFYRTEDGTIRSFYDLNALAQGLSAALIPKALMARLTGDATEAARVEGAKWVIDSIVGTNESLVLEAQFGLPE